MRISLIFILLFLNIRMVLAQNRDTVYTIFQFKEYECIFQQNDSGNTLSITQSNKPYYKIVGGDGYTDSIFVIDGSKHKPIFIFRDIYCDGSHYYALVETGDRRFLQNLYEVYAGTECDMYDIKEITILDNNNDGFQELYFYYKVRGRKLKKLTCSKRIDTRTFFKK